MSDNTNSASASLEAARDKKLMRLRKRIFKLVNEAWELSFETWKEGLPEMSRHFIETQMRAMWSDGSLRTDEEGFEVGAMTTIEQELDSAWNERDTLREMLAVRDRQLASATAALKPFADVAKEYNEFCDERSNVDDPYSILQWIENHGYWSCVDCFAEKCENAAAAMKQMEQEGK